MDLERVAAFSHFKSQELHLGGDRTELEMPCYCGQNQRCNTYERNKMKIFSQKTSEEYGVAAAFFFSFWYAVLWSFYEFLTIRGLLFMHRSEISPLSSYCLFHPHENWMACSTFFLSFANIRKLLETIRSLMCETSEERKVGKLGRRTTKAQRSRSNKNNIRKTNLANKIKNKHHPLLYYFFFSEILFKLLFRSCLEEKWSGSLIIPKKISESTFFSSNK